MKIFSCAQGSSEWLSLRAGIPTASEFSRLVTPKGAASKGFDGYLRELLAERIMGHPCVEAVSSWMNRGSQMEAEAVSFYEFQRDAKTSLVGFVTNDEGTVGASPDRFADDDVDCLMCFGDGCDKCSKDRGCVEIKCPSEHIHVGYLMAEAGASDHYKPQTQGQLWITGRQWVDVVSYHPHMPLALFRVERDEKFIEALADQVMKFSRVLENTSREFKERGWIKAAKTAEVAEPSPLSV